MKITLDLVKKQIDLNDLESTFDNLDISFLELCEDEENDDYAFMETREFYLLNFFRKKFAPLAEPLLPNKLDERIQIIFYTLALEYIDLNKDKLEDCPSWLEYQKTEKEIIDEVRKDPARYDPSGGNGDFMSY